MSAAPPKSPYTCLLWAFLWQRDWRITAKPSCARTLLPVPVPHPRGSGLEVRLGFGSVTSCLCKPIASSLLKPVMLKQHQQCLTLRADITEEGSFGGERG
ncbi:hypothetical protein MHYP_G00297150 [Metynnis hypsauchen]